MGTMVSALDFSPSDDWRLAIVIVTMESRRTRPEPLRSSNIEPKNLPTRDTSTNVDPRNTSARPLGFHVKTPATALENPFAADVRPFGS
jgi:hypothetical protein